MDLKKKKGVNTGYTTWTQMLQNRITQVLAMQLEFTIQIPKPQKRCLTFCTSAVFLQVTKHLKLTQKQRSGLLSLTDSLHEIKSDSRNLH